MENPPPSAFSGMLSDKQAQSLAPSKGQKKQDASASDISNQLLNASRRLRILEERYSTLRKKTTVTDTNMLEHYQDFGRSIQLANDELTELRRDLIDLRDKMRLLVRELKSCATSEEVKILQNYLSFWEPVNFVTRNEVEKIIEEKLDELLVRKETGR
ncbi:hypothetical protein HYU19_04785 [Candidatus Woesearchaeota archaeon]|nr:hypothetical protein [Candidatus Woesearchaeota archaeon]